jgi:hypothetical protein
MFNFMNNEPTLEQYLYGNPFNIIAYESLEQYSDLFEPLEFFNLLYGEFDFFENNSDNYLLVKNAYSQLEIDGKKLYFFLFHLTELIKYQYFDTDNKEFAFSEAAYKSFGIIEQKLKETKKFFFPEELKQHEGEEDQIISSPDSNTLIRLSYTNSQLVLIFYYFLKNIGLDIRKEISMAPVAKFMHLVTGRDFTKTVNSEFYNKLKLAPNHKSDKELIKDLEFIKPLFSNVELNEVVKLIDAEIMVAKEEYQKSSNKR